MAKREIIVELRLDDGQAVARFQALTKEQEELRLNATASRKALRDLELEFQRLNEEQKRTGGGSDILKQKIKANRLEFEHHSRELGITRLKLQNVGAQTRELGNNLSGLTAAGLRFRDKMAEAARVGLGAFGLNILGVTAGITAAVAVLKDAGKTVANFQQQNANLASILGKSRDEISKLTESAIQLGPALGRLPEEVTQLQTELAKLGFTEEQILDAQAAVIQLANATGETLPKSAEIAAATIKGFGLEAKDTQRVVDLMAQSFNSTALDLEKFGTAMSILGPVSKNAGVSIEETTALVGILADRGVDASTIGTSMRDIFIDLAAKGITLNEALDEINGSTDKVSKATELFGKRSATTALILADNVEQIEGLTVGLENAGGAAQKMADEQLNTLTGASNQLAAAWDALILSFEKGDGVISGLVTGSLRFLADALKGLAGQTQDQALQDAEQRVEKFVDNVNANLDKIGGGNNDKISTISDEVARQFDAVTSLIRNTVARAIDDETKLAAIRAKLNNEALQALEQGSKREFAIAQAKLQLFDEEVAKRKEVVQITTSGSAMVTQGYGGEIKTLESLKETLKGYQETLQVTDVSDQATIATTKAKIAALEAEIRTIEKLGTARASVGQVDQLQTIAPDVSQVVNPLPVPTPAQRDEAEEALIAFGKFSEQIRLMDIEGKRNYDLEIAALDAEFKSGQLASEAEYQARRRALMAESTAFQKEQNDIAIASAGNLFGALAQNFKEGSQEQKAFAIIQASINAYLAASQALADTNPVPFPIKLVQAAAAVALGLSYVSKIQNQGFQVGGYTPNEGKTKPVGVVHGGEWVAPQWMVKHPNFAPVIEMLEEQRTRRTGTAHIPYLTGGPVTRGIAMVNARVTETDLMDIENAVTARLSFDRPIEVDVVQITKQQRQVAVAQKLSTA